MFKFKLFFLIFTMIIIVHLCFSDDLIDLGVSNQSLSTMAFEENEYDWLLDPVCFSKLQHSTLFFALDSIGSQFSVSDMGVGFRGGYAWIMDGFSPLFAFNYVTKITDSDQTETENIDYNYTNYDIASGRYAQIDESVGISSSYDPLHNLKLHLGGRLNGPICFDLQLWWLMDRQIENSTSYTNIYTDTASPSENTLSSKGNRTEALYEVIKGENLLAFEPEIGLNFGSIKSTIAVGIGLYNIFSSSDSSTITTTQYSGGLDPTVMNQEMISKQSGSYYYDITTTSVQSCFDMDTNAPIYLEHTRLLLDTQNIIVLGQDLDLLIPASFGISMYPELSTVNTSTTIDYDDSTSTPQESSRSETITTTNLNINQDLDWGLGCTFRKSFKPTDYAALYLGLGVGFNMSLEGDTRSRTLTTNTKIDNDGDGLYTTAGTDVDTSKTESGWEIKGDEAKYIIDLTVPISVSYSPVKPLTFYAGTDTGLAVSFTDTSTLVTGDVGFIYEEYTDNLDSNNSYEKRQIDGSNNTSIPTSEFITDFNFSVTGRFGFTLDITESFKIDGVAVASNMRFDQFSLIGIYSFK